MSLPESVIAILRGGDGYSKELEDVVGVGQMYYCDGLIGRACEFPSMPPEFPADVVEMMERFLRQCWEQGRQDANEGTAARPGVPPPTPPPESENIR